MQYRCVLSYYLFPIPSILMWDNPKYRVNALGLRTETEENFQLPGKP